MMMMVMTMTTMMMMMMTRRCRLTRRSLVSATEVTFIAGVARRRSRRRW
jgi:hypothetical protein